MLIEQFSKQQIILVQVFNFVVKYSVRYLFMQSASLEAAAE